MEIKRKLLIRVDANDSIGYGHYFRCLSIALMVSDLWEITFAICEPTPFIIENIESNYFKYINVRQYNFVDIDSKKEMEEIPFDLDQILREEFHSILIDGYFFGAKYFETLAAYPLRVIAISDSAKEPIKADILINSNPQANKKMYSKFDVKKLALGTTYSMLRPEFYNQKQKEERRLNTSKLLISFGGADYFGLTEKMVELCLKSKCFNEIHLILKFGEISDQLKEVLMTNPKVFAYSKLSAVDVINIMNLCSIAILPSSGIIYESVICGLPTITCWYAENQKQLHHYLTREHQVPTLGFVKNEISMEILLSSVKEILQNPLPKVYKNMGDELREAPRSFAQLFA